VRKRADGSQAVFPHFVMDRGKPGMMTINQAGRRFVSESTSYHLFALAMQDEHTRTHAMPAFMIGDAAWPGPNPCLGQIRTAPGIALGLGLVFGYIAERHAAQRAAQASA